jgi:hypothetical protein
VHAVWRVMRGAMFAGATSSGVTGEGIVRPAIGTSACCGLCAPDEEPQRGAGASGSDDPAPVVSLPTSIPCGVCAAWSWELPNADDEACERDAMSW